MTFKELSNICGGKTIQFVEDWPISHLLIDSRKATPQSGSLFFAIQGTNHDGHLFVHQLYELGVRQFVVEDVSTIDLQTIPQANVLEVDNAVLALQKIAEAHRHQFDIPVIGVTGSNGKTIVKEWLAQMLSASKSVVKSPKSYNSQIGVPLSLWQISDSHEIGVFETGISKVGEMAKLEAIVRPNIGVFTNIGSAHNEGFENLKQKAVEKARLFQESDTIIYCQDHNVVHEVISEMYADKNLLLWSFEEESLFSVKKANRTGNKTELLIEQGGTNWILTVPFSDSASIENCVHCIVALIHIGYNSNYIQTQLNELNPLKMRLELKQGINRCYLIDDSYSNDLAGLQVALDFLSQQKQREKKTVILSDMLQSGMQPEALYASIANKVNGQTARVIGIGSEISQYGGLFDAEEKAFYPDTQNFLSAIDTNVFQQEVILVKGARAFSFEKIVQQLQLKIHGTVLEINLEALTHNLNYYRSLLKPETKIMVMVKAFAYGSGSFEIANLLQFHRVDYLVVAYADEGIALRENGIRIPIMVMNPAADSFVKMTKYDLEPEIYSVGMLQQLIRSNTEGMKIHLKLDTGMHRLGFQEHELDQLISLLKNHPEFEVASTFSHLAGADEAIHKDYSAQQYKCLKKMSAKLQSALDINRPEHLLNSAGIVRFPDYQLDMVRLGIGLYGIETNNIAQDQLQPIGTLKTTISQIKQIKKGETIGYSRKGVASRDMQIATIAIGYADGFDRGFSNGVGHILVNGKKAPVVGNVCMDMTMIDITGLKASEGDEVVVFGEGLSLNTLANAIDTIPYEILTNVGERVKRVFFTE